MTRSCVDDFMVHLILGFSHAVRQGVIIAIYG